MTESGFVSVVRHRDDGRRLLVRARDRRSLEAFCETSGIDESDIAELTTADYRFRVTCSNEFLIRFLQTSVNDLDYDNFKSRVALTRGRLWHDVLLHVWRSLRRLEQG